MSSLSGRNLDSVKFKKKGNLISDFENNVWLLQKDSVTKIEIIDNSLIPGKKVSLSCFKDSISPVLLKWEDRLYFQDYFKNEAGIKTYFKPSNIDSIYIISTIRDSLAIHLAKWRSRDVLSEQQCDDDDAINQMVRRAARAGMNGGQGSMGVEIGARSVKAGYEQPLIYGFRKPGDRSNSIPLLKDIYAPIFIVNDLLVQLDQYSGNIDYFNKKGQKVHRVPLRFHNEQKLTGSLRRIYHPLVDHALEKVYIWYKQIDHVEVYELDLLTGRIIRSINLETFSNVRSMQVDNGSLFFLYDEKSYPRNTRLFRIRI